MNTVKKQIELILSYIDWDLVGNCLINYNHTSEKNLQNVIAKEKDKLQKRLSFVTITQTEELICDYWIIKYTKTLETVQVYFTPAFISAPLGSNSKSKDVRDEIANNEFKTLHAMLDKAQSNENYELCEIIKNRLEQIIDEME